MSPQSPEVNHVGLGKVTRKVLDRLAPFCHMKETSLERTYVHHQASSTLIHVQIPSPSGTRPQVDPK